MNTLLLVSTIFAVIGGIIFLWGIIDTVIGNFDSGGPFIMLGFIVLCATVFFGFVIGGALGEASIVQTEMKIEKFNREEGSVGAHFVDNDEWQWATSKKTSACKALDSDLQVFKIEHLNSYGKPLSYEYVLKVKNSSKLEKE